MGILKITDRRIRCQNGIDITYDMDSSGIYAKIITVSSPWHLAAASELVLTNGPALVGFATWDIGHVVRMLWAYTRPICHGILIMKSALRLGSKANTTDE